MMANDMIEISQIVTKPSASRRSRKAIISGGTPSRLEEPGFGMRAARRAAMLGNAGAARDIRQLAADDADPLRRRRLAADADAVLVVDQDLPDLLRGLVGIV